MVMLSRFTSYIYITTYINIIYIALLISSVYASNASQNYSIQINYPKVMICTIMINKEYLYVDEWIQYNIFLGFDFIQIYDNTQNGSDYLRSLPNRYGKYVNVSHLPGELQQYPAYQKCIDDYKHLYLWAAIIDADEFIFLPKHHSIGHFIHDVKHVKHKDIAAIHIKWFVVTPNHQLRYKNELLLKRFTERVKNIDVHGKSIVYLPDIYHYGHPHKPKEIRPGTNIIIIHDPGIAVIYHYYAKSFEEYIIKRKRGYPDHNYSYAMDDASIVRMFVRTVIKFSFNDTTQLVNDTSPLDFFLKNKYDKSKNSFDCPLINYTLTCMQPYKDEVLIQDKLLIDVNQYPIVTTLLQ